MICNSYQITENWDLSVGCEGRDFPLFREKAWQKAFTKARERFSILQSEMGLILILSARAIVLQERITI